MTAPDLTRAIASARSAVDKEPAMPTPRPPADDRDGLWLPAGRYEVRIDEQRQEAGR